MEYDEKRGYFPVYDDNDNIIGSAKLRKEALAIARNHLSVEECGDAMLSVTPSGFFWTIVQ